MASGWCLLNTRVRWLSRQNLQLLLVKQTTTMMIMKLWTLHRCRSAWHGPSCGRCHRRSQLSRRWRRRYLYDRRGPRWQENLSSRQRLCRQRQRLRYLCQLPQPKMVLTHLHHRLKDSWSQIHRPHWSKWKGQYVWRCYGYCWSLAFYAQLIFYGCQKIQ